jgi:hypothetical protein
VCKQPVPEIYVINDIPGNQSTDNNNNNPPADNNNNNNNNPPADNNNNNSNNPNESQEPIEPESSSSNTLSFPELGPYNPNEYFPFVYMTLDDEYYLHFNVFGRGWDSKQIPDTFILQKGEAKGDFPIGKWINIKNNDEYVEFTSTHMTRYSPYKGLGTLLCKYTVDDGIIYIDIVSHVFGE